MLPRIEDSKDKKFTKIPKDLGDIFKSILADKFKEKYAAKMQNMDIFVEGRIYPEEVILMLGLGEKKSIARKNFCCSINHSVENKNTFEQLKVALDALDPMLEQAIEADFDIELPLQWHEFDYEEQKVYMQFNTFNFQLEDQAADFLREQGIEIEDFEIKAEEELNQELLSHPEEYIADEDESIH